MKNLGLYEELFNLPSVKITDVKIEDKVIEIQCKVNQEEISCPNCGKPSTSIKQYYFRRRLQLGSLRRGQSIRFGEQLPDGQYLLYVQYDDGQRVMKLLKMGK